MSTICFLSDQCKGVLALSQVLRSLEVAARHDEVAGRGHLELEGVRAFGQHGGEIIVGFAAEVHFHLREVDDSLVPATCC